MMHHVVHPGPIHPDRLDLHKCEGRDISLTLQPDMPLEDAVAKALSKEDIDSAWLEIKDAPVSQLDYVIPAHSDNAEHVAWYSKTYQLGAGKIDHLGMMVGRHNGKIFIHGHGLWSANHQAQAMGHILALDTKLAEPTHAQGIGLKGVQFERKHDDETNFELFQLNSTGENKGNYAGLRLKPNQDFATALNEACTRLKWPGARAFGLGSLIGVRFEDELGFDGQPTEFLVTNAVVGLNEKEPEIAIVGVDGSNILSGRLARGKNAILITAELVLRRTEN